MSGTAIIVAGADPDRFRSALTLAAAQLALGGPVRLLLDAAAVPLAAREPELLETCFDLGARVTVCQSGLAAAGLAASDLDPRFAHGGMVGWLADLGADRLVVV